MNFLQKNGNDFFWGTFTNRKIFQSPLGFKIDVFFDRLEMCHTVDFRKRLEKKNLMGNLNVP